MSEKDKVQTRRMTGILFILGAVLVNVPYTLLIINFDYPDILREPVGHVLIRFQAGGSGLIWTWFAFAWVGIPLLFAILMLRNVLESENIPYLDSVTAVGLIGGITQMIGLLRWTFVVPGLANLYSSSASSAATKEAAVVTFQAIHQFGGVLLGEHIGQTFTIMWMALISLALLRSNLFPRWVAWLGIVASIVYTLAEMELLATVIPSLPVVGPAGLIGSLLWLAWLVIIGIFLVREKTSEAVVAVA